MKNKKRRKSKATTGILGIIAGMLMYRYYDKYIHHDCVCKTKNIPGGTNDNPQSTTTTDQGTIEDEVFAFI